MPLHRPPALRADELEPRIAPATIIGPTKVTYQDADGDSVTVVFSKPVLTPTNVNNVFTFNTGSVSGSNAAKQQLRAINVTAVGQAAAGTAITVNATRSPVTGGDGFAAVGHINAEFIDLGRVTIDGDLGRIVAGDPSTPTTSGLKGLTAQSIGRFGIATGAPTLSTLVVGKLDFLRVKSDVWHASIEAQGGAAGRIGPVFVGGSLVAGPADAGLIGSSGDMGFVTILGDLTGGAVESGARLAGAKVGGSVRATSGSNTGWIRADGDMGFVTIQGDLIGGGHVSGAVNALGRLAGVTVGGSVRGGAGDQSGWIKAGGDLGFVNIGGDLTGAQGAGSGEVNAGGKLAGVRVGGSVRGGLGSPSGHIRAAGAAGAIAIRGDLVGGSSTGDNLEGAGFIEAGRIASITLGGSLIAGVDNTTLEFRNNGAVRVEDDIGTVLIRGSIVGNPTNPAVIAARGKAAPTATTDVAIGGLRVLGRVEYARLLAGYHIAGLIVNADAQIGAVTVGGDWVASSIAAGAHPGGNDLFGDADDVKASGMFVKDVAGISSRVASLTVGGQAAGTIGAGDHFGVVAELVGAVTVGGTPLGLNPGQSNDDFFVGISGDFKVNEV